MTRTPRRRPPGRDPERGSVTVWLITSSLMMITVVGMAVDLTGQVYAQQRTQDIAAQAARAAGQRINTPAAMRGQSAQVSPAAAAQAARAYLTAAGITGSVTLNGPNLTVHTTDTYHTKFLSIIGLNSMPVTGQASARIARTTAGVEN